MLTVFVMFISYLIATFVFGGIVGMLCAWLLPKSSRIAIKLTSAMTVPVIALVSGAYVIFEVVTGPGGGGAEGAAFFFAIGMIVFGLVASIPGALAGHFVSIIARPNEPSDRLY